MKLLKKNQTFYLDDNTSAYHQSPEYPSAVLADFIQADANIHSLGPCLLQNGKPIAFASQSLADAETKYANIERELTFSYSLCMWTFPHIPLWPLFYSRDGPQAPRNDCPERSNWCTPIFSECFYIYNILTQHIQARQQEATCWHAIEAFQCQTQEWISPRPAHRLHSIQWYLAGLSTWGDRELPDVVHMQRSTQSNLQILRYERKAQFRQWPTLKRLKNCEHPGITKCHLMACSLIYRPGLNRDIEDYGKDCATCMGLLPSQPAEPLINHKGLLGPW